MFCCHEFLPQAFEKAFVAQLAAKNYNLLTGILILLRCTGSSKHPSNQMIGLERFMTGAIFNFTAVRLIIFFRFLNSVNPPTYSQGIADWFVPCSIQANYFMQTFHATNGN